MKTVSYSYLSEITGFAYRTVKARLQAAGIQPERIGPNGAHLFSSPAALKALYAPIGADAGEGLDPKAERALLDRARREAVELATAERKRVLAPVSVTGKVITDIAVNTRQKLLGLPSKVAAVLPPEFRVDCAKEINRVVGEVLSDLAAYVPESTEA